MGSKKHLWTAAAHDWLWFPQAATLIVQPTKDGTAINFNFRWISNVLVLVKKPFPLTPGSTSTSDGYQQPNMQHRWGYFAFSNCQKENWTEEHPGNPTAVDTRGRIHLSRESRWVSI